MCCRQDKLCAHTWPKLAAAMGCVWKEWNRRDTGAPSSASMMAMALSGAKAGTLSCSLASSSVKAAGKRSDRVENSWPTLMKVGPRRSRDSLHGQSCCQDGVLCLCAADADQPSSAGCVHTVAILGASYMGLIPGINTNQEALCLYHDIFYSHLDESKYCV